MPAPPRRVMYVNHVAEISGAEGSLLALIRHLDRRRFTPTVACPHGPLALEAQDLGLDFAPIPHMRAARPRGPIQALAAAARLKIFAGNVRRAGEELECDLVHANSLIAGLGAAMGWGRSRPVIWHARDLQAPARAERWMLARATRIIAISGAVVDHLFEVHPRAREKTTLIYNGIDPEEFRPERSREQVRGELGVPDDAPLVGNVGQLVPWKRQDLFIEVAARVLAQTPDAHFAIIGADLFGEHQDYVARLRASAKDVGLADRLVFAGYREDMPDVMAALDVMAHTADAEPLGRVLLEAMSLGVPCVAARAAGPAEIIDHDRSGLLVEPGDGEGFAREVASVLGSPALAGRLGEAAIERTRGEFSAHRTAQLTEEVYEEALADRLLR